MNKLQVELEYDQVENVVVQALKEAYVDYVLVEGYGNYKLLGSILTMLQFYLPEHQHQQMLEELDDRIRRVK